MANCSAGSLNIRNKFCGGLQKHALVLLILLHLSQNEQYERVISGFAQTFSMPGQIRVITVDRHKRRQADIVEPPARTNTLCCRSWFPLSGCPARRFSVSFSLFHRVPFNQAYQLIAHGFPARPAEMNAHLVGRGANPLCDVQRLVGAVNRPVCCYCRHRISPLSIFGCL